MAKLTINCDMGEGFGIYAFGADEQLIRVVELANVACGFHASDFDQMRRTVVLARAAGVRVGAHPSLPDLQGFGRREMNMSRKELGNCLIYQIGALSGFLKAEGLELNHIKPHGALYGMAARNSEVAHAIADAADVFPVPIMGLAGTEHETVYTDRGHRFMPEFFADLDYDAAGRLLITREHGLQDIPLIRRRVRSVTQDGELITREGTRLPIRAETICIHSDTPNALAVAQAAASELSP